MAKRGVSVGVEITGSAKGFKNAAEDAAKATAEMNRKSKQHAREVEQNFKMFTIAMAKVAAAIVVAKKAFETYGKVMNTTNSTGDTFAIQQSKLKFSINEVGRSLATTDFKEFGKRMADAAKAGEALAKQLDRVFDLSLRMKLIESGTELAMVQQELIYKNKANPWEVRVSAAEKYLDLVKELESEQLKFAQEEVKAALGASGVSASKLSEERLRFYVDQADVLAENEDAVKKYLAALKEVANAEKRKGGYGNLGQAVMPETLKTIANVSDAVKDFAQDYKQWMLITDPESLKLTESWAKLDKVMTAAGQNALKPMRTVNSLLAEEAKDAKDLSNELEKLKDKYDDLKKITLYPKKLDTNTLAPMPMNEYLNRNNPMNQSLEDAILIVDRLDTAFSAFFSNMDGGIKGMAAAFLNALRAMAVQAAASAATFALLALLTGGASTMASAAYAGLKAAIPIPGKAAIPIPGFAAGTNYAPGGLSLVGERGPELVNLPRGSKVIPMNQQGMGERLIAKLSGTDIDIILQRTYSQQAVNT